MSGRPDPEHHPYRVEHVGVAVPPMLSSRAHRRPQPAAAAAAAAADVQLSGGNSGRRFRFALEGAEPGFVLRLER